MFFTYRRTILHVLSLVVCITTSVTKNIDEATNKTKLFISGIKNKSILTAINEQVEMISTKLTELEREFWIKRNINTIYGILCTFGYFDAEVKTLNNRTAKKFNVKLNKRYTVEDIECLYSDACECNTALQNKRVPITTEKLLTISMLKKGQAFLGNDVSSSINKIRDFYKNFGYAFVQVEVSTIKLNKRNKSVKIVYKINLGKVIKIRNTIINIASKKSPELLKPFVRNRIPWKRGDYYNVRKIEQFKNDLVKYDLFSSLDVKLSDPEPDANEPHTAHADVVINLEEAQLRNVQLGLNLSTTNMFNVFANWKHYNIDGKGSTFEILGNVGKNEQIIKTEHNYYDIFTKNQKLFTQIKFTHEDELSYNVLKYSISSTVWHNFANLFSVGIGGFGEYSKTIDKVVADEKLINSNVPYVRTFGIPLGVEFDATTSNIDPNHGFKIFVDFTPMFSENVNYFKLSSSFYRYFGFGEDYVNRNPIFALYAKYGTILGNSEKLNRDKMFFAGGANSIRGYGKKKLGAMLNNIPYGGSSLIELGLECRIKFNKTIGSVIFIETGKLYNPEKQQNWMTGIGFGVRYVPPINLPVIRVDVAFPTKRRKDNKEKYIDSAVNIYVGIGQAF